MFTVVLQLVVCFPDTQDNMPKIPVHLTRVGVTGGVKKLLKIERGVKKDL